MEKDLRIMQIDIKSINIIIDEKAEGDKLIIELAPDNEMNYRYAFPFSEKLLIILTKNILGKETGGFKEVSKKMENNKITLFVFLSGLPIDFKVIALFNGEVGKPINFDVNAKDWFLIKEETHTSLMEMM